MRTFARFWPRRRAPHSAESDPGRVRAVYFASFAPTELCGISDPAGVARDVLGAVAPGLCAPILGPFLTGGEAIHRALESANRWAGDILLLGCERMTHLDAGTAAGLLGPARLGRRRAAPRCDTPRAGGARDQRLPRRVPRAGTRLRRSRRQESPPRRAQPARPLPHAPSRPMTCAAARWSPIRCAATTARRCPTGPRRACCPRKAGTVRMIGWGAAMDAPRFHERRAPGDISRRRAGRAGAFGMAGRVGAATSTWWRSTTHSLPSS